MIALLKRLLGKAGKTSETSKAVRPAEEAPASDNDNNETPETDRSVAVRFQITTVNVADHPFELMLNTSLADALIQAEFNWLWTITLKSFHNDRAGLPVKDEKASLLDLMKATLQAISTSGEIQIVGTSLYQGQYEIMFYAREEDKIEIGATIAGLPETLEDRSGRFLTFSGAPDANWDKAKNYYLAFKKQNAPVFS